MLNCIIIDDEQFSVDAILKYIELLPRLNILAIYNSPIKALECVSVESNIDLIFMDIGHAFYFWNRIS